MARPGRSHVAVTAMSVTVRSRCGLGAVTAWISGTVTARRQPPRDYWPPVRNLLTLSCPLVAGDGEPSICARLHRSGAGVHHGPGRAGGAAPLPPRFRTPLVTVFEGVSELGGACGAVFKGRGRAWDSPGRGSRCPRVAAVLRDGLGLCCSVGLRQEVRAYV